MPVIATRPAIHAVHRHIINLTHQSSSQPCRSRHRGRQPRDVGGHGADGRLQQRVALPELAHDAREPLHLALEPGHLVVAVPERAEHLARVRMRLGLSHLGPVAPARPRLRHDLAGGGVDAPEVLPPRARPAGLGVAERGAAVGVGRPRPLVRLVHDARHQVPLPRRWRSPHTLHHAARGRKHAARGYTVHYTI